MSSVASYDEKKLAENIKNDDLIQKNFEGKHKSRREAVREVLTHMGNHSTVTVSADTNDIWWRSVW